MADSTKKSRPAAKPVPAKAGKSSSKTPKNAPAVKSPAKAPVKKPAKPVAKAAKPPVKAAAKVAKAPVKATAKPVKAPAKPVAKPITKATPKVAPKAAAKVPPKAAVKKPVKAPVKAAQPVKAPAKPVAKPITKVVPAAKAPAKAPVKVVPKTQPKTATPARHPAPMPKHVAAKPVKAPAPAPKSVVAKARIEEPAPRISVTPRRPAAPANLLLQGGTWVTMNLVRDVVVGDLRIEHGRITALGEHLRPRKDEKVVDVRGLTVFPGFIQLHVHLCQTLFRHMAEDMALFDWLRNRIWPLEAAHNPASMAASARLGILELLLSGTTTVFTMESTAHTETVFAELLASGLRAFSGKALMDGGRGVPAELREDTAQALDGARRHLADWHGKGRLGVTLCPRFAPSCSSDLLRGVGALARESGAWVHTHIAETRDEVQLTRETFGRNPVQLYEALGYLEGKFLGVHAVHLNEAEKLHLAGRRGTVLVHCPSANLKLGSGVMPLSDLLSRGIRVGLGADGAACNNSLSMIEEMRLAGLLQKVSRGASSLSADTLLELATIDAARAIGLDHRLGSIELGKAADLVFFNLEHPAIQVAGSPAQQLVWSATARDLVHTMIEGEFLVKDRKVTRLHADEVLRTARVEARRLVQRAGLEGKVRV